MLYGKERFEAKRVDKSLTLLAGPVMGNFGSRALCPALVEVGVAVVSADNGALLGAVAGCGGCNSVGKDSCQ
jgi:hypothetical protein